MRIAALLLSASAALASAVNVGKAVNIAARQNNGAFSLDLIPAICDANCTTYKEIFGTCPSDPSNAACGKACNQTVAQEFVNCTGCLVQNGPAAGMAQHDIDILNIAQQQLVQQCIEQGSPAQFSGTVQLPSTVAYPSGVVNATYSVSAASTSAPASSATSAPAASASAPAASESAKGSAGALRPAAAVGAVVAAAAIAVVL